MESFWDFLFDTWWPFIIGGCCILGLPVLTGLAVWGLVYFLNKNSAKRERSSFRESDTGE
jgi:hypothetical protein